MTRFKIILISVVLLVAAIAFAGDYGAIRGVVHDPQHRPVQDAMVMLKAKSSEWTKSVNTDSTGQFQFNAVGLGEYSVSVASVGFLQTAQDVVVTSGSVPVVHFNCEWRRRRRQSSSQARPRLLLPILLLLRPSSAASTSSALPARTALTAWQ